MSQQMSLRTRRQNAFRHLLLAGALLTSPTVASSPLLAQQICEEVARYRIQSETVWEPVQVTVMKVEYEERTLEKEIVSYRPTYQERWRRGSTRFESPSQRLQNASSK